MSLPPLLDARYDRITRGAVTLLVRRAWRDALDVDALLDGAPLEAWGEPREHALRGRAAVTVVGTPRGDLVAKSITRGGALGRVARRHFARGDRLVDEACLGERLRALDVDTPPLIVGRVTRGPAFFVTLDSATARVPGALDLFDAVHAGAPPAPLARAAGDLLRRMHDVGFRHRDLTVKNLLAPGELIDGGEGRVMVIDLDRCRLDESAPMQPAERTASMARFVRSGVKRGMLAQVGVGVARDLVRGYAAGDPARARIARDGLGLARRQVGLRKALGLYGR